MPKFDFGIGTLNDLRIPVTGRSLDLNRSDINQSIRIAVEEAYTPDMIGQTGPYKAVVLRVESVNSAEAEPEGFLDFVFSLFSGDDKPSGSTLKKMTAIKARVPEIHGHLPVPSEEGDPGSPPNPEYKDHYIIDMYPTYTSESDRAEFSKVKPGDIVIVDYGDKKNFTDPIFVTPIAVQQHMMSAGSGQGAYSINCNPPTGMMPAGSSMAGSTDASGHTGIGDDALRSRDGNKKCIMFGDSQMSGKLGKALQEYVEDLGYTVKAASGYGSPEGAAPRMGRTSSPVATWLRNGKEITPRTAPKWGFIASALKQYSPELIVICLGGNGVGAGNPTKLINKIRNLGGSEASVARILWVGPPPAAKCTAVSSARRKFGAKVTGPNWALDTKKVHREGLANQIESEISILPNVFYVNTPKIVPNYPNDPGEGCDGVHMTAKGAVQVINAMKKRASEPAAGPVTPENAQRKPKHPNQAGASPGAAAVSVSPEKLKEIFAQYYQNWTSKEDAESFLKERANVLYQDIDIDKFLSREWLSGYLIEDGHAPGQSVDISVWEPMRISEMAAYTGYTSFNDSNLYRDPYGVEILLPNKVSAGSDIVVGASGDTMPMGDVDTTRMHLKTASYEMAAAVQYYTDPPPKDPPATASTSAATTSDNPPCPQPMANTGGGGTIDPSGPVVLPPNGVKTFTAVVEDAINNAVAKVSPLNIGISSDQLKLYLRAACMVESGGRINVINSYGYSGLWQWGGTAWKEASRKGTGRLYQQATGRPPPPFIRDYNYALSPYVQAIMTACAVSSKIKTLKRIGAPVIAQHIYMIHNQGAGGFSNIWKRMRGNNTWGGTLASGGSGDFRRAWANGCKMVKRLGKKYTSGENTTPWLDCRPSDFYNRWTIVWNSKVKKVSKPDNKGGIDSTSAVAKRMAYSTNVGEKGFKSHLSSADRDRKGQRDARVDFPGGPSGSPAGPGLAGATAPTNNWRKA